MIFNNETPEPNRALLLRDSDGDWWGYTTGYDGTEGWQYSQSKNKILGSTATTNRRSWAQAATIYGPFTLVSVIEDGNERQFIEGTDRHYHSFEAQLRETAGFTVKDSGVREEYANGFVRDTEDGKHDYSRLLRIEGLHLIPVEALERWAAHMVLGAAKYGEDNWRQARGPVAVARFIRSLCRHVVQFVRGDMDEDHGAAIMFNVAAVMITPKEGESDGE